MLGVFFRAWAHQGGSHWWNLCVLATVICGCDIAQDDQGATRSAVAPSLAKGCEFIVFFFGFGFAAMLAEVYLNPETGHVDSYQLAPTKPSRHGDCVLSKAAR
jgi:hypothetical protein